MYNQELEVKQVDFNNIYLDPNNPRFWTEKTTRDIPDKKITEDKIQSSARTEIQKYGIDELYNSILRNGFLPLDRIVVRKIDNNPGKYVVVEGNRRVAALTLLRERILDGVIDEEHITDEYLQRLFDSTNQLEVLVYKGKEHDIAWLLQGIRHISGIRNWEPAQRARLVAEQIDKHGLSKREAGQQFGLSAQAVGRLYRSFKALEQMRSDDEFQSKARNDYFTLFEEAIRNSNVKKWLDWDDNENMFKDENNLKRFYSWIIPDEDDPENRRRIHDPRQIKRLGVLVSEPHVNLLEKVDQFELSIDHAYELAITIPAEYDWREALNSASTIISEIPQSAISKSPDEFLSSLSELESQLTNVRKMAEAVR